MKYLLWDFDNTLGYREGMWSGTLHSVLESNGICNIKLEDVRRLLKNGFTWHYPETPHNIFFNGRAWWEYMTEYFVEIYEKLGISKKDAIKFAALVQREYKNLSKWHIYDDVISTLEVANSNNYQNVILSNHIPELDEIIDNLGIKDYFTSIYTSGKIGYEKPNLQVYDYVIKDLKIEKTQCLMIGDNYDADVAGALRAGIKAILVRKPNENNYRFYCKDVNGIIEIARNILL
ncbi:HAD family hydrolase [Nostoc sp. UHCC 0302]|uniref:HAD family hydrolase n=1 Tax=Nostoc sp. UHCC 0302 TaxID=3134896 RepID=UPI00311CAFDF